MKGDAEAYVLPDHVIYKKIEETLALGGTGILMQGGVHPDLKIDYYEKLLSGIKERYQDSLPLLFTVRDSQYRQGVQADGGRRRFERLKAAGLDSMPGGGGEILDDEIRNDISPLKCNERRMADGPSRSAQARTAHDRHDDDRRWRNDSPSHQSFRKTSRNLQDETGGFTAFIPWTFQPEHTELAKRNLPEVTAAEYLRMLALSRIYLDNIDNVQVSWLTVGLKVGQVGLRFGVNDMGSIMIEENVISAAGARNRANDAELRRVIAGRRLHSSPAHQPLRTLRQLAAPSGYPCSSTVPNGGDPEDHRVVGRVHDDDGISEFERLRTKDST